MAAGRVKIPPPPAPAPMSGSFHTVSELGNEEEKSFVSTVTKNAARSSRGCDGLRVHIHKQKNSLTAATLTPAIKP